MSPCLTPTPPATATPISTTRSRRYWQSPVWRLPKIWASHKDSDQCLHHNLVSRRKLAFGLAGVAVSLSISDRNARAARRPPPPPPEEKRDPNVTGLTAKVLASKKRKEAMKEAVAKLRERGKAVNEPSQ